jgi:hypothetical protein
MVRHVITEAERMCLHSAARDLHSEFRGIFGPRSIRDEIRDRVTNLIEKLISG